MLLSLLLTDKVDNLVALALKPEYVGQWGSGMFI